MRKRLWGGQCQPWSQWHSHGCPCTGAPSLQQTCALLTCMYSCPLLLLLHLACILLESTAPYTHMYTTLCLAARCHITYAELERRCITVRQLWPSSFHTAVAAPAMVHFRPAYAALCYLTLRPAQIPCRTMCVPCLYSLQKSSTATDARVCAPHDTFLYRRQCLQCLLLPHARCTLYCTLAPLPAL